MATLPRREDDEAQKDDRLRGVSLAAQLPRGSLLGLALAAGMVWAAWELARTTLVVAGDGWQAVRPPALK